MVQSFIGCLGERLSLAIFAHSPVHILAYVPGNIELLCDAIPQVGFKPKNRSR